MIIQKATEGCALSVALCLGHREELQQDLDTWMWEYNHQRAHSGPRCDGKTPYATFQEAKALVREKLISA